MRNNLHHLHFLASDIAASISFYTELLDVGLEKLPAECRSCFQ